MIRFYLSFATWAIVGFLVFRHIAGFTDTQAIALAAVVAWFIGSISLLSSSRCVHRTAKRSVRQASCVSGPAYNVNDVWLTGKTTTVPINTPFPPPYYPTYYHLK